MPEESSHTDTGQDPQSPPPADIVGLKWAVVGLVVPVSAYVFVYSALLGEARHYGIPSEFISVSFNDILRLGVPGGSLLVFLILAAKGLSGFVKMHSALRGLLGPVLYGLAYALVTWWGLGSGRIVTAWFLFAGVLVVLAAVALFLRARRHGGLRKALDAMSDKESEKPDPWSPQYWFALITDGFHLRPRAVLLLALVAVYVVFLGMAVGRGIARLETQYLVAASRPHQVVLLVTGGEAVLGRLSDGDAQTLSDAFEVVEISSLGPISRKEVGQLKAQKPLPFP